MEHDANKMLDQCPVTAAEHCWSALDESPQSLSLKVCALCCAVAAVTAVKAEQETCAARALMPYVH